MHSEETEEKCAFTFLWRIENFCCWAAVGHGECLDSPRFKALNLDGSVWYLRLFPKGENQSDKCVKLSLIQWDKKRFDSRIDCEWSCLGIDGLPLTTRTSENRKIEWGNLTSLPNGPTHEEVFVTQKTSFLPSGTFTLRCRIWKCKEDLDEEEHVLARTRIDLREDSFVWSIEGFSTLQLQQRVSPPVEINFFPLVDSSFTLNFSLNGASLEDSSLSFEITAESITQRLFVTASISILDYNQKVMKCAEETHAFQKSKTPGSWVMPEFMSRQEILKKSWDYLCDDVLTLLCKSTSIARCSGFIEKTYRGHPNLNRDIPIKNIPTVSEECTQNSQESIEHLYASPKKSDSMVVLREDLLSLYRDPTMSDFELRSGDVSFPVHKVVLSARSPVFKVMLSGDMREAKSGFLDIPDVDAHTLNRMLTFLYAGTVEHLQCVSAAKLYYAADKYQVLSLKQECSSLLQSNISVSNVCDVLALADRHQDQELISFAHDFFLENFDEILLSEGWGKFLGSDAYLAGITVREVYKRKIQVLKSQ